MRKVNIISFAVQTSFIRDQPQITRNGSDRGLGMEGQSVLDTLTLHRSLQPCQPLSHQFSAQLIHEQVFTPSFGTSLGLGSIGRCSAS